MSVAPVTIVTLKVPEVYTAVEWHPDGNISGPSMGGIQASHVNSFCLYLNVKGQRVTVEDGDFIVYKNEVPEEVLKPRMFFARYNGIKDPNPPPAAKPAPAKVTPAVPKMPEPPPPMKPSGQTGSAKP